MKPNVLRPVNDRVGTALNYNPYRLGERSSSCGGLVEKYVAKLVPSLQAHISAQMVDPMGLYQ